MKSVLIVDDSEADQYLAKATISQFSPNIEILQAYDGQEALDILSDLDEQPAVIFLDINMPRMNGHEFLHEYGQWENQTTVIVMLTSSEQEADKTKSRAYKCVKKYFTKPLDTLKLKALFEDDELSEVLS